MASQNGSVFRPALFASLASGYNRRTFLSDLTAGVLVGVVALPLSMALAIASGVEPGKGLVTSIIGGLVVAIAGGSRVQIAGPAGAFVGLCAAGIAKFGYSGLAIATVMAGILMIFMGLMRLGRAIAFIPIPVVIGFTTGIALILASTQIGPALDIEIATVPHFHERINELWLHRAAASTAAAVCCVATIAVILAFRRFLPRWPGGLIAICTVGVAAWAFDIPVATIQDKFGHLPPPPSPSFAAFGLDWSTGFGAVLTLLDRAREVSGLALAIALLGSVESLLSAVVADGMAGDRHDANTELIAQGAANTLSPIFLGLPVTGVIARTATNIRAGARTPVAAIVHSLTLLVILVAAGPLVVHVPMSCLAGVLLVVCYNMCELRHWPHILRAHRSDAFLLPVAFLLTVLVDLTWAVVIGVLLALLFFVRRMAESTRIIPAHAAGADLWDEPLDVPPGVQVYEITGPFFFGAATLLRDFIDEVGDDDRVIVLRMRQVPFIDATALFSLRELLCGLGARNVEVVLSGVLPGPHRTLRDSKLIDQIGHNNVCREIDGALRRARQLVGADVDYTEDAGGSDRGAD